MALHKLHSDFTHKCAARQRCAMVGFVAGKRCCLPTLRSSVAIESPLYGTAC
jgi:hypothetical protein